jgi:hypothetical protein
MKKSEGFFQKIFGSFAVGSSRVPLRSNIFKGAGGYSQIGSTGGAGKWGQGTRRSPLLGSSSPSNLMSLYYERVDELRGYQLLDVVKLATNFFADYIVNFLEENEKQVVTILDLEGNQDEVKTERINEILIKDLNVLNYIRDHIKDMVFYGQYTGMLMKSRDELGHLKFRIEELYDPISVITKKKRNKDGGMDESYLARGEDGKIYEIPKEEAFTLGSNNLRLINDLDEKTKLRGEKKITPTFGKKEDGDNRSKVLAQSAYSAGEPLFYSLILKVKELIIKELLVSLISLRDLSSTQLFLLQFDKSVPLETAKELCARTTKLANNTNELASFLTSQFDAISFIENVLSQSAKFIPDYNATLGNKNSMLPLDKLSDKLLDIMQTLENCRSAVLSPLGIPATILDSTSGSKWQILQQSERANSRVAGFMVGIKESVTDLVKNIYKILYNEELEVGRVQLHISEKTSVEYNNQINQSESISGLVNGISGILTNALQVMEAASPLIDPKSFLGYIQGLVKDIDPSTEAIITDETIEMYSKYLQAKFTTMCEQQGIDPASVLQSNNVSE